MKKKSLIFILIIFLSSCGFKVVKKVDNNINIAEIEFSGDKRINYRLKNKLAIYSNKEGNKLIKINLQSTKEKNIKEKNIKNEITKYDIMVEVKVELQEIGKSKISKFVVSETMDYDVAKHHSKTLDNEKKIIDLIIENIADKILNNIRDNLDAI